MTFSVYNCTVRNLENDEKIICAETNLLYMQQHYINRKQPSFLSIGRAYSGILHLCRVIFLTKQK